MEIKGVKKLFLTMMLYFGAIPIVFANNLNITNLNVASVDTASGTITFTCDVVQDNSWRSNINNDAVWMFMKYSTDAGQTWNHASMFGYGTNPSGFAAGNNFALVVPTDEKGFFLQRTDYGTGTITVKGLKFVWNYAQDGVTASVAQAANTIHKIFGVEMVYIPQGAFYAGDGNSSSDYRFKAGSSDNNPHTTPTQVGNDSTWVDVECGTNFTIGQKANGTIWAWGNNATGQLGIGNTSQQNSPVQIGNDSTWIGVSCGGGSMVGFKADGSVWCSGDNSVGQLGNGSANSSTIPLKINGLKVVGVSSGPASVCVLQANGKVKCWGLNSSGMMKSGACSLFDLIPK